MIAFVPDVDTDAQKARLFKAVHDGLIRVLFGSNAKMGVGTNVQTSLYALHHLDAPWRPCEVEHRARPIATSFSHCPLLS